VDDASAIQQMSQGYVQNLAFSNRANDVVLPGSERAAKEAKADANQSLQNAANEQILKSAGVKQPAGSGGNASNVGGAPAAGQAAHNPKPPAATPQGKSGFN
jgi:hypothetical protein